ncbi:hypothetical protein BOTCAL_1428g00010 [Botryotinia calthae]|uniref:Uncharacterized protein n=1 Tax=Botryotinia calthae TaxID=38488 RepID=A0A4Y8CC34_9HELO|nr:hypothetical protein BOTCAL_1428g00010 [Botryotinia calthae]
MSDTPGSSPTGSRLEELRASIRTSFADWQYLADELSKVTVADLRSPHVSTTPEEQEYFSRRLCSWLLERSSGSIKS